MFSTLSDAAVNVSVEGSSCEARQSSTASGPSFSKREWIYSTHSLHHPYGNKRIDIATDYLRWYAEGKAVPRGTTAEVTKFFVHDIALRHGDPFCPN